MELNEKTLQVLKNFATINPNIVIQNGSAIRTLSEGKNVFGKAQLDVEFPQSFGIYDLNEFLSVINLVEEPHLSFDDNHVKISDATGLSKIQYFFTDMEYLTTSTKDIVMPEPEIRFTMTNETLNKIKRAAAAFGHKVVAVRPNNGSVSLTVFDEGNATSNTFTVDVEGSYQSDNFDIIFNIANLKLLPGIIR